MFPDDPAMVSVVSCRARQIPTEQGVLLPSNLLRDTEHGLQVHGEDNLLERFLSGVPIRQGDILVEVEGNPTPDHMSYRKLLSKEIDKFKYAGMPINIRVQREEKLVELRIPLQGSYYPRPRYQSRRCSGFDKAFDIYLPLPPEQCGGPVIDSRGDVIGVIIAHRIHGQIHTISASELKNLGS